MVDVDSGVTDVDSGVVDADGGVIETDGGVIGSDAGEQTCTGPFDGPYSHPVIVAANVSR